MPIRVLLLACAALICGRTAFALNPSSDISQYGHTAWTARDGLSLGAIFAMAQTPDGYLWLGAEFGLFRFDGIHSIPWQPPAGQHLPAAPYSLLVTRDGTLWIGTFNGLVSWSGDKLTSYPEFDRRFVTSMLEDREGTVWAGTLGGPPGTPTGRLCAIRNGNAQCYGADGAFGSFVWSLCEDGSGVLWVGAESGLWRWRPGPPKRYAIPEPRRIGDLITADDGRLLVGVSGGGLKQLVGDKLESYPIRDATNRNRLLPDRDVDSNKLLRDRDGGLWIGTHARGLIHIHNGRTDVFTKSDGLSGNISCSLFEDREGNIWVGTTRGLERFRELAVTTISAEQGLSSDYSTSVLAATDGSIWFATHNGLTEWKNGRTAIFRKANGLPEDVVQSLYQDDGGRIWVSTGHGLADFKNGRFVAVRGVPSEEVYSITGDKVGNLWLSGNEGLSHLRDGHLVEHFPWSALGHHEQAKVVLFDRERGGLWLAFWAEGGVLYFKDGQVRASYTPANGPGQKHVSGLHLDRDGALWASTDGGLSRIKDGRIATLTSRNGLPCDKIHWSIEDNDRSFWLYTACGLVRVARAELDAWNTDPNRRVATTVWDAADGVTLRENSTGYDPPVAKPTDGKLWFLTGEGIQVVDPHHLAFNKLSPPVHIEQIVADHKMYWQNLPGAAASNVHLPARTRDLQIDYTALSLTAPEKVHFKYKLEGQDRDWREVVNDREVQYSNLPPGPYQFRVIACNNSGVWNEEGAALDFVIPPAWYQTNWFRALCVAAFLALLWALYQLRLRQLAGQFNMRLEERVGERTRIARDLHDTLLQSFQGLVFRFQGALNQLPNRPEKAYEVLESALISADQAIAEGRSAIQELRSGSSQESNLEQTLLATGRELASSQNGGDSAPTLRVIVEGTRRAKQAMIREEIYRIARELLRNAYRHAHARSIEAELRYDDAFVLIVRDDGKGIDPQVLQDRGRAGHWGLRGLYERAEGIGARLDVWSEAGAGTEVRLTVPGAVAYEKSGDGGRFKLFRKTRIYERRS